ncbi:MAG: peptidylprolyl isomerase [Alphaproteobacteria bacterium]|nr:MAG: peptidylprolyl isomerase [Alphaproteobacteria bacterium]
MKNTLPRILYRYFGIFAIFFTASFGIIAADHEVIATVNDLPISNFDLTHKTKLLLLFTGQPDTLEAREAHKKQALQLLVREMLQIGYVEKLGVKFSDKEFDDALARLEHMNNKEPGFFKKLIAEKGISLKILRLNVLANYAWQMLISERFANFITVSNAEIDARLALVKKQQSTPHVHFYEIVLPFDSEASRRDAEQTGYEVLQHLDNGADFRALAQQVSQSGTASVGGDVGWVALHELDPPIQHLAKNLSIGKTSSLTPLPRSYHIIMMKDKKDTAPAVEPETFYSYVEAFIPNPKNGDEGEKNRLRIRIPTIHKNAKSEKTLRSLLKGIKNTQIKSHDHITSQQIAPQMLASFRKMSPGETLPLSVRPEGWYITVLVDKKEYTGEELIKQQIKMHMRADRIAKISQREMNTLMRRAHTEDRTNSGIVRSSFTHTALEGSKQ